MDLAQLAAAEDAKAVAAEPSAADIAAMEAATAAAAAPAPPVGFVGGPVLRQEPVIEEPAAPAVEEEAAAAAALAPLVAEQEAAAAAPEPEPKPEPKLKPAEAEAEAALAALPKPKEAEVAPAEEVAAADAEEEEEVDPFALGNEIAILSSEYGYIIGRIVYRDTTMIRVMPREVSDRAIEYPLVADGTAFAPVLGVSEVEVLDVNPYAYYVDFLGAKPGEVLEFFTKDGRPAREPGTVAEIIKSATKDSIKLTDGTVLKFRGIGPTPPIAVIRVRTAINAPAAVEEGAPADAAGIPAALMRQADLDALLRAAAPVGGIEAPRVGERVYPDSMQREDMFQDLMAKVSAKQKTNPRRIRSIEREVDLLMSLKNTAALRDDAGFITGPAPHLADTLKDVMGSGVIPAVIPIVEAARVLNLDDGKTAGMSYKPTDVEPRTFGMVEETTATASAMYEDDKSGGPLGTFLFDIFNGDARTLVGRAPTAWAEDQDIVRTAGLDTRVQALSIDPASYDDKVVISLAQLSSDTTDRYMRVLGSDYQTLHKYGQGDMIAPSDPSVVAGYVVIPTKAALSLRPPKRPGDLPMALIYSAKLQDDNLPTVARTLADLYTTAGATSPLNAYTLDATTAGDKSIADWLETVLKYAVHPVDSLGPRSAQLLSVLDTLGIGYRDLSPAVSRVIGAWVRNSQKMWRDLLVAERERIKALLDAEAERTFQSVAGDDSPTWQVLRDADVLKDLLEDIQRRNPTIYGAPTLLTASLLGEAQGDAAPLVWTTLARYDGRELGGIDEAAAVGSLAASRAYVLRRKALRDFSLLQLHAEPEINTCPHVKKLEAVRNVRDVLQRARLLRDFIDEYQGGKSGDWITCVVCRQNCVCYHELIELEALAQPQRMEAIQKQLLIRFGGERFEGKIICKNCGQGLQDIEYDDHVEFDDDGRPVAQRSVLTEEQLADPEDTTWKKSTAALVAAPIEFASQTQREIGEILTVVAQAGGLQIPDEVFREIVRRADVYVSARAPKQTDYEAQRQKLLLAASTRMKSAAGGGGGGGLAKLPDVPTYGQLVDKLRVSAVAALTALAIQVATPPVAVPNPQPLCPFSREGWPLQPEAKAGDRGALLYIACVLSFVQKDYRPWNTLSWVQEPKPESRRKQILEIMTSATLVILGSDPKAAPLPFTPDVRTALTQMQTDVEAKRERQMLSNKESLPAGFRPEPFPPAMGRPAVERDPLPAVQAAVADGGSIAALIDPVAGALRQQAIAVVGELHTAAKDGTTQPTATVCCPTPMTETEGGALLGAPEALNLVAAGVLLRGAIPTAPVAGTHLWAAFAPPEPQPVDQSVEEGVLFKLFLKYCYRGPQVGEFHEFSAGDTCRQCGLRLGKPLDTIDFGKEGAAILAAQQGDLRVEPSQAAFDALSDAVRRRKLIRAPREGVRVPWRVGLELLVAVAAEAKETGVKPAAAALQTVLERLAGREEEILDEVERAGLWEPVYSHMDSLRAHVEETIGPLAVRAGGGALAAARAREATAAMAMFDQITADPFIDGPRTVQEYWCAKTEAAGKTYGVTEVRGAKWFKISQEHNEKINKILAENANWYAGEITDGTRATLQKIGAALGPIMRAWLRAVRPGSGAAGPWTGAEAQAVLRMFVLQAWADALLGSSWMYADIASPGDRENTVRDVANWTRALMFHVRQQYMRYSKERIAQVLQQRAELERTSVVKEFSEITDPDMRAAYIATKQLKIGRWARGANIRKLDPDQYEFEVEQRHKMGIVDAPVDPILLEGAAAAAPGGQDFGFGDLGAAPEAGYDANQAAEGDDY